MCHLASLSRLPRGRPESLPTPGLSLAESDRASQGDRWIRGKPPFCPLKGAVDSLGDREEVVVSVDDPPIRDQRLVSYGRIGWSVRPEYAGSRRSSMSRKQAVSGRTQDRTGCPSSQ